MCNWLVKHRWERIFVFSLAKGVTQDGSVSSPFITAECCVKGRNFSLWSQRTVEPDKQKVFRAQAQGCVFKNNLNPQISFSLLSNFSCPVGHPGIICNLRGETSEVSSPFTEAYPQKHHHFALTCSPAHSQVCVWRGGADGRLSSLTLPFMLNSTTHSF